jgi:hypothetical protein
MWSKNDTGSNIVIEFIGSIPAFADLRMSKEKVLQVDIKDGLSQVWSGLSSL